LRYHERPSSTCPVAIELDGALVVDSSFRRVAERELNVSHPAVEETVQRIELERPRERCARLVEATERAKREHSHEVGVREARLQVDGTAKICIGLGVVALQPIDLSARQIRGSELWIERQCARDRILGLCERHVAIHRSIGRRRQHGRREPGIRGGVSRVELDRTEKGLPDLGIVGQPPHATVVRAAQISVICFDATRWRVRHCREIGSEQLDLQSGRDAPRDLVLNFEDVGELAVESRRPQV
jgi:hypothetical protein